MSAPARSTLPVPFGKPFTKNDPRRSLSGGRPRKVVELEKILDEHRDPILLRRTMNRLRDLALGETVYVTGDDGERLEAKIQAHPGFMKLYLERVLGPVPADTEAARKLAASMMADFLEELRARRAQQNQENPDPPP